MGPLFGARVDAFSLNANGSLGPQLGSTVTDPNGAFHIQVAISAGKPVGLVSQGGNYIDEASGLAVSLDANARLRSYIDCLCERDHLAINSLTEVVAARTAQLAEQNVTLEQAVQTAQAHVRALLPLPADLDLLRTLPHDLTRANNADSNRAVAYGTVLASLSQLLLQQGAPPSSQLALTYNLAAHLTGGATVADANLIWDANTNLANLPLAGIAFLRGPNNRALYANLPITPQLPGLQIPGAGDPNDPNMTAIFGGVRLANGVADASVVVNLLNVDGSPGRLMATTVADPNGDFAVAVPAGLQLLFRAFLGTGKDPASGSAVPFPSTPVLEASIADAAGASAGVFFSPLTTFSSVNLRQVLKAYALANSPETVASKENDANAPMLTSVFGINLPYFRLSSVDPVDLSRTAMDLAGASQKQLAVAAVTATLSQLIAAQGAPPTKIVDFIAAISRDWSDGYLDDLPATTDLLGNLSAPSIVANSDAFFTALDDFLDSSANNSGYTSGTSYTFGMTHPS